MMECMQKLLESKVEVGIVSGSDRVKLLEQFPEELMNWCHYCFTENGLVAYKQGVEFSRKSFKDEIGEEKLQDFINFVLGYLSQIRLPCKWGTFIEYRSGMMNISPIGRNCSREEWNAFEEYDKTHNIRKDFIKVL